MSFLRPNLPDLDVAEWSKRPHLERIRPLSQHWVENGFGSPSALYLLYVVKMAVYVAGAVALISTTPGLGLSHISRWWSEPIVFQKFVVWNLLFEALGLGGSSGPLTFRFMPPVGGFLYWLRPGTTRLPAWPDRVPLTRGNRRSMVDVALYAGVIASALYILLSPGGAVSAGNHVGTLHWTVLVPLATLLPILGARDKTIFWAARSEQYFILVLVFFFPLTSMIAAAKVVMVGVWWGAATSKLNHHFPFIVSVMMSNSPLVQSKSVKRAMYRDYPDDILPSKLAFFVAHTGTVIEYLVPLLLLLSHGGTLTVLCLVVMVIFHLHIIATFPVGAPLEWNIFVIFSALFLFGHYASVSVFTSGAPLLVLLVVVAVVATPIIGNIRPDLVSFLPSFRYYAGNWATSLWCFRKGCEDRLDECIKKTSPSVSKQLTKLYGAQIAELIQQKGMAWRSMHSHGRGLNGLLPRALDDPEDYDIREGELIAGGVLGWNFSDGHLHDERLLAAVQDQCNFAPGELRVVMLESEPALPGRGRGRQCYRIADAATGEVERGYIKVDDMVTRQPWLGGDGAIPVTVTTTPVRGTATA